jgi:hypothetical protein
MKRTLLLITLAALTSLTSCKNLDTAQAVAIGQTGLDLLVAKKVIKPEEAAAAQKLGQILITPTPEPITPSGK